MQQQRQIFLTLAKRRHVSRKNIESKIQVIPEATRANLVAQVRIDRRHHTRRHLARLHIANPLDPAFLQRAQQFALCRQPRNADFVEKKRAAALPAGRLCRCRAFRCTNLTINITDIYPGKRDSKKLKPHSHDDFEQITLSAIGLPAGRIHTSQAQEAGCRLVDIFGPPRRDYSLMPGFVRNAHEYPLP